VSFDKVTVCDQVQNNFLYQTGLCEKYFLSLFQFKVGATSDKHFHRLIKKIMQTSFYFTKNYPHNLVF
jgi:hypothetical protein